MSDLCCGGTRTRAGCEYHDPALQLEPIDPAQADRYMFHLGGRAVYGATEEELCFEINVKPPAQPVQVHDFHFHYHGADYTFNLPEDATAADAAAAIARAVGGSVQPDGAVLLPGAVHEVVVDVKVLL